MPHAGATDSKSDRPALDTRIDVRPQVKEESPMAMIVSAAVTRRQFHFGRAIVLCSAGMLALWPAAYGQQPAPPAATPAPSAAPAPAAAPSPPAVAAPAPAAPPSWHQGRTDAHSTSTLHPFAPILAGRPAK